MQLRPVMEQRGLKKLFVATDATPAGVSCVKCVTGHNFRLYGAAVCSVGCWRSRVYKTNAHCCLAWGDRGDV